VLEGFAGKAVAQANCLKPRPLLANGKSRVSEKPPKPELKNAQKTECTVALPRWPSRKDGTGTEPRASDEKRNDMGK
jgi:hypothetical protein